MPKIITERTSVRRKRRW